MTEITTIFFLKGHVEFMNYHGIIMYQMCTRTSEQVFFRMNVKVEITGPHMSFKCEQPQPFWIVISLRSLGESAAS